MGKKGKNYQADRQQCAKAQGMLLAQGCLADWRKSGVNWLIEHGEMRRWPSQSWRFQCAVPRDSNIPRGDREPRGSFRK